MKVQLNEKEIKTIKKVLKEAEGKHEHIVDVSDIVDKILEYNNVPLK